MVKERTSSKEVNSTKKEKGLEIEFQGIRGFNYSEETTDDGRLISTITRGVDKTVWMVVVNDRPSAINAMLTAYASTINMCLKEAEERVKNPSRTKEIKDYKEGKLIPATDPMPILSE